MNLPFPYPPLEEIDVPYRRVGPDPLISLELMGKTRDIYDQDIKPYAHQRW